MLYSKSYSYRPSGNSQSQSFTFTPNGKLFTLLASVYTIGVATVIVLALATLAAAVYICSLLVTSICQLASQIAVSYSHAGSFDAAALHRRCWLSPVQNCFARRAFSSTCQMRCPMNDMQERPLQVYRERGETNPLAAMLLFFVGLVLLIVFAAALIVSWHEFVREAPAILIVLLIVAGLVLCGVLIVAGIYKGYLAWLRVQHAREELASMKDERRRAQDRHDVQKHLALTRLHADERGNRPVIYDPYSGQVITLPSGNFVQNVSSHYAPHITYPGETRVTEEKNAPDQLPSPARIPTFSEQLQRRITAPHEPQSILGYTDGGPRLGQWDKLHSFFVCGGSGSGKSSTVSYYAALAVLHGARLLVIDPDAEEDDSITQRLAGLEFAFYAPVARDPQSAARIIALAERELESPGDYPLVWIVDEFTSIMRAGEMSDKGWGAIAERWQSRWKTTRSVGANGGAR